MEGEAPTITPTPDVSDPEAPTDIEATTAMKFTQELLDGRIATIRDTVANTEDDARAERAKNLPPGEKALYEAAVFRQGFPDSSYAKNGGRIMFYKNDGGLSVTKDGTEVHIVAIVDQELEHDPIEGQKVSTYKCMVDLDHPDQIIDIPADNIVAAHLAKNAEEIAGTFTDRKNSEDLQAIVSYGLQAKEGDTVPENVAEAIEREAEPMTLADRIFEEKLEQRKADFELVTDEKTKARIQREIGQLQLALKADGEGGAWIKQQLLGKLATEAMDTPEGKAISDVMDLLEEQADTAQQKLTEKFKEANISEEQSAKLLEGDLDNLLNNGELLGLMNTIDDLDQVLFGRKLGDEEMQIMADSLLSDEQKQSLIAKYGPDYAKKLGKGLLWTVIIAIVGAAIITLGAGVVATSALSGAGGR